MVNRPNLGEPNPGDSNVAPLMDVVSRILFILLGIGVAWALGWGPARLHQSYSMHLVEGIGLPWKCWSLIYVIYSALLISRRSRVLGYFLGFILYGFYLTSYIISVVQGHPGSAPGIAAGVIAVIAQASGWVRSMVATEWR